MKPTLLKTLLLCLALAAVLLACAEPSPAPTVTAAALPAPQPVTLNVFAAASLTEAFGELGRQFEADHPGVTVIFNFAGSQTLAQQISDGAPVDVFASASQKPMGTAIQSGRVLTGTAQAFVKNRLVLVAPKANAAGVAQLQDLAKPGLKLVLAAKEVPVGQYALDMLDKAVKDPVFGAAFKDGALQNVVSYENDVKAVLAKVVLGEADAGIVYTSDVSGDNAAKTIQVAIPDALNVIAKYPIAALHDSPNPALAQAFVEAVLSPAGQALLAKYGFIPVK